MSEFLVLFVVLQFFYLASQPNRSSSACCWIGGIKDADDDKRIVRPAVILLGRAEVELKIFRGKLVQIFLADFLDRFCGRVGGPEAFPAEFSVLPVLDHHRAAFASIVFEGV